MIKIIRFFTALQIYKWLKPKIKSLSILLIFILIIIYIHNEFLEWSEITENKNFVGYSFIIKNLLLFLAISFYILILRVQSLKESTNLEVKINKEDGFDKFRNKEKLKTKAQQILEKDGR
jgi:large-conductance mechanosensitive channel